MREPARGAAVCRWGGVRKPLASKSEEREYSLWRRGGWEGVYKVRRGRGEVGVTDKQERKRESGRTVKRGTEIEGERRGGGSDSSNP